jgi:CRP/FNR family cyclic AMP-dependent transcriptional regulator
LTYRIVVAIQEWPSNAGLSPGRASYAAFVDADVRSAILASHLRELPADVLAELLAGAVRVKIQAGSVTHREGEHTAHLELVVSGVVRVFVTAPDGRTMTVRYCKTGALLGVLSLFATGFVMPATTQAVVDAEVLRMPANVARRLGTRDVRVARAFLNELSERVLNFIHEIPGSAFATVRQRLARHLLDLACEHIQRHGAQPQSGQELVVAVSQQELADAVGTVREVVVRALRELRQEGLVRTERDRIVLLQPTKLLQEAGVEPTFLT